MNSIMTLVFCVSLVLFLPTVSISQDWSRLRPLHSTCEDVKRILNVTTCEPPDNTYDVGDERVQITFSTARCHKAWQKLWNVPPGTVMSIERSLRKRIPLTAFHIDENRYKKVFTDFTDQVILISRDEGIELSVIKGEVNRITYAPTPKDDYLLCPNSPKTSKQLKECDFPHWFDKYGDMTFSREKDHLDTFARELAVFGPGSRACIMVYAGLKLRKSVAQQRVERTKNYLIRKRGIGATRIEAIYAGRRERFEVELYIVPSN